MLSQDDHQIILREQSVFWKEEMKRQEEEEVHETEGKGSPLPSSDWVRPDMDQRSPPNMLSRQRALTEE